LTGVAVNVTAIPLHVGLAPVVIAVETEGITVVFTVIVVVPLVAVVVLGQVALEVSITSITSLLASVVLLKTAVVAPPTGTLFILH
jgi:hypothetical protein